MDTIPKSCRDGAPALSSEEVAAMAEGLQPGWTVDGTASLTRSLEVQDFKAALRLVNRLGEAAEEENHHPDLLISNYRQVTITLSTHDVGGLSANDFVMARRADALVD